ncbi:MAG: epoxide hydrolase family protein [Halioglobus sp.]
MTGDSVRAFEIDIAQPELDDLQTRLALTRFPQKELVDDWDQGIPLSYVKELTAYWQEKYDWRRCERALNKLPNYMAQIDGLDIHFIHVKSGNSAARPLLISHGWPGSILEFLDVIEPLSQDFHIVIPSLPGFGFSGQPVEAGWDLSRIARAWHQLMSVLGYQRWFAQGGDWGSAITEKIASQNLGGCAGIHVNMVAAPPNREDRKRLTAPEEQMLSRLKWYQRKETGFSIQQSSRPQTLGYGLADSPVGQMAWIVEKFHGWSDCADGNGLTHPENVFGRDHLLDNVMIYWLNNAATSSAQLYWHSFGELQDDEIEIPFGGTIAPWDIFPSSRRWAEKRRKNIVYWNELDRGGHFLAMERADDFVKEVRNCFRQMAL